MSGTSVGIIVPVLEGFFPQYLQAGERSSLDAQNGSASGEAYVCFTLVINCRTLATADASVTEDGVWTSSSNLVTGGNLVAAANSSGAGVSFGSAEVARVSTDGGVSLKAGGGEVVSDGNTTTACWVNPVVPLGACGAVGQDDNGNPDVTYDIERADCIAPTGLCLRSDESGTTTWGCTPRVAVDFVFITQQCWSLTRTTDGKVIIVEQGSETASGHETTITSDGDVSHVTHLCPALCVYSFPVEASPEGVFLGYYGICPLGVCIPSGEVTADETGADTACRDAFEICDFWAGAGPAGAAGCKNEPFALGAGLWMCADGTADATGVTVHCYDGQDICTTGPTGVHVGPDAVYACRVTPYVSNWNGFCIQLTADLSGIEATCADNMNWCSFNAQAWLGGARVCKYEPQPWPFGPPSMRCVP